MLTQLFYTIYNMQYSVLLIVVILLLAAGGLLHIFLSERAKHIVGIVGTALALWLIIYATILSRSETGGGMMLTPGYSIKRAMESSIYLRMVLLNIFLFIPYGVFVTLAFDGESFKKTLLISILSALCITVLIEVTQVLFRLGTAETDDVILNVFGAFLGILPYIIVRSVRERRQMRHSQQ